MPQAAILEPLLNAEHPHHCTMGPLDVRASIMRYGLGSA
jgi:hypothetical protein